MPLIGLCSEDGKTSFRWGAIDLSSPDILAALAPADPATLAFLIGKDRDREGLSILDVSASNADKEPRQLWLERTIDYYAPPSSLISGAMGTIRHATMLKDRTDFIVETRYQDEIGSAQIDTFHIPTGILSDLKTVGWYKLKKILQQGIMQEGRGYALQVNRQRMLLERATSHRVQTQILMVIPPDLKGRTAAEAASMGVKVMTQVEVPFMDDNEVLAHYANLRHGLSTAITTGTAPMCSGAATWEGAKCTKGFCMAAPACKALADLQGEVHPWIA